MSVGCFSMVFMHVTLMGFELSTCNRKALYLENGCGHGNVYNYTTTWNVPMTFKFCDVEYVARETASFLSP